MSSRQRELSFFDEHPIEMGGFRLLGRGAEPIGTPTLDGWQVAFAYAGGSQESSPYWVGDLLEYASGREDWRERFDQAKSVTKLAEQTLHNLTTISRKVKGRAREVSPSISHSAVVTKLEPAEQEELLEEAAAEGWTVSELNRAVRIHKRAAVVEGQAVLEGMYRVLYADPPWLYSDSGIPQSGALGKAARHYPGMTPEQLAALPVEAHALTDSVLFCWSTASFLPIALQVVEAWGFTYKTNVVWDKVLGNWGHYVRVHHEHLLIATRGACMPDVPTPMPDSVQTIRRSDEHSAKPEEFRQMIQKLYTRGPYLELFGRKPCQGWSVFGNDARLWAEHARASA